MKKEAKKLIHHRLPPECDEEAKFDAFRLIQTGKKCKDDLTTKIGQARLRLLENRATAEDIELLEIKS